MSRVVVDVAGRRLTLTNLEKVLYPAVGFTKGQVLDYYTRVAPVLLPHLAGRALTRRRYPDGVGGTEFFERDAPPGTPDWVRLAELPAPGPTTGRRTVRYTVLDSLAALVWTANLASLELHTHQWRVGAAGPDAVVLDLDPGPPAGVVQCCRVALLLRPLLEADGLVPVARTSGGTGLQVCARWAGGSSEQAAAYARALAQRLGRDHPDLVVHRTARAGRPGRVLVDWSRNDAARTTVAVYSLRAGERPTASTPLTWAEVAACAVPGDLVFTSDDVLARVAAHGDLFAPLLPGP